MNTDKCLTCRFWAVQFPSDLTDESLKHTARGHCRYKPPQTGWPVTLANQWCGKHETITADNILSNADSPSTEEDLKNG